MINVTQEELALISNILKIVVPNTRVLAFGSRYKKNNKPYSDLDLAVDAGKPIGMIKVQQIKELFEASVLPYRVDLIDYQGVSPEFQAIIDAGNEVIFDDQK